MIKHGYLDIIVGTHALLGSQVVYNNLGLLVVDEEQVCFLSFMLIVLPLCFWLSIQINSHSLDPIQTCICIYI